MAKDRLVVSEIGEMISLVVKHGAMSFGAGEPSDDMYPKEAICEAMAKAFKSPDIWGYYHDDYGDMNLRSWITEQMRADGMLPDWVAPENVLITNGAGEAINLISEALIDAGSVVLVESPTYTETLSNFRKQGAVCVSVPSDDDGIIPDELAKVVASYKARFLYTIPNFQNPSGRTTPLERRVKILEILQANGIALLEDDPYHYLSYDGVPPTSYLKLAGDDKRVIHCNSFSKIVAPGLRAGWVIVPPALRAVFSSLRNNAGLGRPVVIQKGIYNFLSNIVFKDRVEDICREYRKRRATMLEMIEKYLSPLGIRTNNPKGGFFIWGEAPESLKGFKSKDFSRYAVEHEKIAILPGSAFFPFGESSGERAFRLSFAKVKPEVMEEGMLRLSKAWKSFN